MDELWRGPDRTWYRIPADTPLPAGTLELRRGLKRVSVAPDAVAPFAMEPASAAELLDDRLKASVGTLRDAFASVGRSMPDLDGVVPSPGKMATDRAAAREGVDRMVEALKRRLGDDGAGLSTLSSRLSEGELANTMVGVAGALGTARSELAVKLGELGAALQSAAENLADDLEDAEPTHAEAGEE
ncbi:MAG: hypothetical protein ACI8PZ_004576 [Myxococcota bacterium]|jgi:hypothetical protein